MYTKDQWTVMSTLASDVPKRPKLKVSDIAARAFGANETSDRRTRNAFRKLRTQAHIEIVDRGEYRITPAGAAYFKQASKEGAEPNAVRAARKGAAKKATKKAAKKATKKAAKKATKKTVAKKATKRAAKKPTAKAASKKVPTPPKKKTNGIRRGKSAGPVTLSF